jgi:hypothetical protein
LLREFAYIPMTPWRAQVARSQEASGAPLGAPLRVLRPSWHICSIRAWPLCRCQALDCNIVPLPLLVILAGGLASNFLWAEPASMYFHGSRRCPGQLPHLPRPIATHLSGLHSEEPTCHQLTYQRDLCEVIPYLPGSRSTSSYVLLERKVLTRCDIPKA